MNTPKIVDIKTALRLYYENSEISNQQIQELFGKLSSATIARLKKQVYEKMIEQEVFVFCQRNINTAVAYEVFGIDVDDLERRMRKLQELQSNQ